MDMITDRKENAVYEYSDLNRVESAVREISEMFPELGISGTLETKTNWGFPGNFSAAEWPVESQMVRYLGNVKRLKEIFPSKIMLPETMDSLTWTGANNIEKLLQEVFARIRGIKQTYRYSGEMFAGEE